MTRPTCVLFRPEALTPDAALERAIAKEKAAIVDATTREAQLAHYLRMRALILQRSPETVERMEKARGLR